MSIEVVMRWSWLGRSNHSGEYGDSNPSSRYFSWVACTRARDQTE